jgi:hypothetical protein
MLQENEIFGIEGRAESHILLSGEIILGGRGGTFSVLPEMKEKKYTSCI